MGEGHILDQIYTNAVKTQILHGESHNRPERLHSLVSNRKTWNTKAGVDQSIRHHCRTLIYASTVAHSTAAGTKG